MNLAISSDNLQNPVLVDVLRHLSNSFQKLGVDFIVIGATARDILFQTLAKGQSKRKTRDIDIAIAVGCWPDYNSIIARLCNSEYTKSSDQTQRLLYGLYEIDIIPYGQIASADEIIYWPPKGATAMSVKNFSEVVKAAITITIDSEFSIRVAPLHGLFLLKLNAWLDRNISTNKDAEDIWHIIDIYYFANESHSTHPEVYELDNFSLSMAGAYWLAYDIASILRPEQLDFYNNLLLKELANPEESRLITQILDTASSLKADEVNQALSTITNVFSSIINS